MSNLDIQLIPPRIVVGSVWLFVLSYTIGYVRILINKGWFNSVGSVLAMLLFFVFVYAIARALYVGKNWVRWISVTLSILGFLYLPWSSSSIPILWERNVFIVQGILQVIAAILLLFHTSSRWFKSNNVLKQDITFHE